MPQPRPQGPDQSSYFKPLMVGLAVGSGCFLILRYAFGLGVEPSLIAATFFAVAVTIFIIQRPK
jgi:hypothetical protein